MSEKNTQQTFWQKTKRFFEPVRIQKFIYFRFFIQALTIPVVTVLSILFLEYLTSELISGVSEDFLSVLFYFGVFIVVSEIVIYITKNWGWMVTLYQSRDDLFSRYFKKYIVLDNNKIEQIGSGKLVGIMHEGVLCWSEILADSIINFASLLVGIVFTLYMIGRIHISLPFIFLGLILIFAIITFFMNKKLQFFRSERYEYKNLVLKDFVKIISSKNEILQSGKLSQELDSLSYYLSQGSRLSKAMSPYRIINRRAAPFLLHIGVLVLFFYIYSYREIIGIDIAFLVGLSGTFILMQKTILEFVKFYVDLNKQMVSVEKLWDFFDTTPQIEGYEEGNTFQYQSGEIQLQDITYGYTENKNIFENFNAKIEGGKITALVGPSGGGKTTLVKLIAGYIRANSGEIKIDEQKLSETSLKSYYSEVGYLTQEPSVFDGTIRENLLYAIGDKQTKPHPNPLLKERGQAANHTMQPHLLLEEKNGDEVLCEEQDTVFETHLKHIIELAQCQFIYDLPNGLETEIGERGVKLSGGQKQRLAIAKIFLKNPKIIILDEPTSALDSVSELKITQALNNLFQGRTVLVIAHRLQTVKHADDILVIENGQIIERGTHASLVRKKGFYKQMLDLQSGF